MTDPSRTWWQQWQINMAKVKDAMEGMQTAAAAAQIAKLVQAMQFDEDTKRIMVKMMNNEIPDELENKTIRELKEMGY